MSVKPDPVEMMALRDWTLRVLARAAAAGVPDCSAVSWNAFLRIERCALPLRRALAAVADPSPALPAAGAAALQRVALDESRRALAARAQLETLARIAREAGWSLVVLKGGVLIATGGELLDVYDVDVLPPPGEERAVADRLDAEGFGPARPDGPDDVGHHLAPRLKAGTLPVEVHRALRHIDGLEASRRRARPLPGLPGLLRFDPADHVWHLLVHGVVQHPERRGCIRELVLLRQALGGTSADGAAAVGRRARAHPTAAGALGSSLRMVRGLARGESDDAFRDERLTVYVFATRFGRLIATNRLAARVASRAERRLISGRFDWDRLRESLSEPVSPAHWFRPSVGLAGRWPRAARRIHNLGRLASFAAGAGLAAAARVWLAFWRRRLRP